MEYHFSTKVKHREEIPKFHEDTPYKFQPICLKVISVYYFFCFIYLRNLNIKATLLSEEIHGLHCEIAVKSGFGRSIREAVILGSVAISLSFCNVRFIGQFASVA